MKANSRALVFAVFFVSGILPPPTMFASQQSTLSNHQADESEWLKSILLLQYASSLTRSEANQLEADLRVHPDSIETRLRLIGFYTNKGTRPVDRLRLREHVLWMIQKHPEHPATGETALRDLPDDPEGNIRIEELWSRNIQQHSNDDTVLRNAEKYYFSKDPAEAEHLIRCLHDHDPGDRQWANELATLYLLSGVPGLPKHDSEEVATEAYHQVLEMTAEQRSRDALAGNMADSYFMAGNLKATRALAQLFLHSPDRRAVQRANTLLGRIALRAGDVAAAKEYLRASANCPAMRSIPLSSPITVLAKELLQQGERDSVIDYLVDCGSIWPGLQPVFRIWIEDIQNGRMPDFGDSL